MNTFKVYVKKEFMEWSRHYKYLILGIGILLFALLDPIMLKLLPDMLKSSYGDEIASSMIFTQKKAMQNYIKDLMQIGLLFITFLSSGLLCEELTSDKYIFPYTKGASPMGMTYGKFFNAITTSVTFIFIGFFINYYYATLLFKGEILTIYDTLTSAILISVVYIVNISLSMFFSSIFSKTFVAGIVTVLINFLTMTLSVFEFFSKFIPYSLVNSANNFSFKNTSFTLFFSIFISIVLVFLTSILMDRK